MEYAWKGETAVKMHMEIYYLWLTILKGLSYEIDFENVDENGQILA